MFCKEIQIKEDTPHFFISKCSRCGSIFHSKLACWNHYCYHPNQIQMSNALIYLLNWISFKMIPLNAIENQFLKFFCNLLNTNFVIPSTKMLRSMIIDYSRIIFQHSLENLHSKYISIMIDGTSRFKHDYVSIILFSRYGYAYFSTRYGKSENSKNIANILNECIQSLTIHQKTICSICSDNFSANKKACRYNLLKPIYRQYGNCHCSLRAIANQFGKNKPNYQITLNIKMALRLLKKIKTTVYIFHYQHGR